MAECLNNNFLFSNGMDKNNIADVLKEFDDYFMPKKNVTY